MKPHSNFGKWILVLILALAAGWLSGCSSSDSEATATETAQAEYDFWKDVSQSAVDQSVVLLNEKAARTSGSPEMAVLTSAGYAMAENHTTQACLDGLREYADVSEGKNTLLSLHSASSGPLWFFILDKANGNAVYSEVDNSALDLTGFTASNALFSTQVLRNVKAENLFADLEGANESIFNAVAFNGNEFRLIGLANLILKDGPYDLIRSVQFHDHYCPGVTSGYYLVKYLEKNFPLTDEYGSYFVQSVPPWCKDDAMMTLLNTTPGKSSYAVSYLNSEETAALKEGAENIAGIFFRWNGSSTAPAGEGTVLAFDFSEAKNACNWGGEGAWNWWESRLKMDLWYLDYLDKPERFVSIIPVDGKETFTLEDLPEIQQPSDLARVSVNPLAVLNLIEQNDDAYNRWQSVGKRAGDHALSLLKGNGVAPAADSMIVLTNAGYAEVSGQTTEACLDGLMSAAGVKPGNKTLIQIQSNPAQSLWFALYEKASGWCTYMEINPDFLNSGTDASLLTAENLFSTIAFEQINAEHLYANAAEYAAKFDAKVFGGNEYRIVTIANTVAADTPIWAVRSFEFHDHYCPGVTSGFYMSQYIKESFPSDSYFIQSVSPWCKEDALMVMLNATPGKSGYAVSYPTDEDTAKWVPEAADAATIVYRKNSSTGLWEGRVLGFVWGDTGCPDYGSNVITHLCMDFWYLERLDQPETFVKVIKEFELPEGVEPKEYARPGVDPMEKLGLTVTEGN